MPIVRLALALVAVALLLILGINAVNASYEDSGTHHSFNNETFNVTALDATIGLNESRRSGVIYDDFVTVENESGATMTDGDDYEWFDGNGTIKPLSGGRLTVGENATIDYGYVTTDPLSDNMATLYGDLFDAAGAMVFVLVVALIVLAVGTLGRV